MTESRTQANIKVWVANVRERWTREDASRLLQSIPEADRLRVGRYRRWLDMQMSVTGLLMIGKVMQPAPGESIEAVLSQVTRSSAGRPSLPFGPDFNIAHSGGIVVLAAAARASGVRVGIDIEVISDTWAGLLDVALTRTERAALLATSKPEDEFFRMWTYKEAVVKADGRGLAVPLNCLSSLNASILLDGTLWSVKRLETPPEYAAHLATSRDAAICVKTFRLHGSGGMIECDLLPGRTGFSVG